MAGPRIHVLPRHLVNQIAAGEVVENAASVVKELLENALDAGASHISVEIERGGLDLVRVSDDGCGMTPQEAVLALERHATSKVSTTEDLAAIRTLGFRGEALPSIASVSLFEMVTRTRDADVGTRVVVREGKMAVEEAACAPGTTVSVRELFRSVPARLKFQKGERSQAAAIRDILERVALAHPFVHITLLSNGRRTANFLPCQRLLDRFTLLFGDEVHGAPCEVLAQRNGVKVSGVITEPACARPDPSHLFLIVNGRPIHDVALRRAVAQAYGVLLPEGTWPVAVVSIDLDPSEVDVNVHPRKTEVRFKAQREVASAVFGAVAEAVRGAPWARATTESGQWSLATKEVFGVREAAPEAFPVPTSGPSLELFQSQPPERLCFSDLRYLGQLGGTVLVCEARDALVLVDQHAAHERVNFERLWQDLKGGRGQRQPLLFPEVVQLSPDEAAHWDEAAATLEAAGFDVEPWGGTSVMVRAVPTILKGKAAAPVVRECVLATIDESAASFDARLRKVVATVACHASVRAGDALSEEQVKALLAAMDAVDLAGYCPHGRRAVVVQPMADILRSFGR